MPAPRTPRPAGQETRSVPNGVGGFCGETNMGLLEDQPEVTDTLVLLAIEYPATFPPPLGQEKYWYLGTLNDRDVTYTCPSRVDS